MSPHFSGLQLVQQLQRCTGRLNILNSYQFIIGDCFSTRPAVLTHWRAYRALQANHARKAQTRVRAGRR